MADRITLSPSLPRPLAFVLGGGASYGAVQVGMLQALGETDLVPDLVVGTSVGALNGAVLAEEPHSAGHRLPYLWSGINRDTVFPTKVRDAYATVRGRPYLVDPGPLSALLVGSLQAGTFADLDVEFVAVTADLDTGAVVPVDRGDLASALLASAAIPGVFPWVDRDGRRLVDGGIVANVPLSVALDRGARSVVVLDCGFVVSEPRRTDTFLGVLLQTAAVMTAHQVRHDLRRAADAGVPVVYLPGPWPIGSPPYSFERTAELAQAAYALSSQFLRALRIDGGRAYGAPPGAGS